MARRRIGQETFGFRADRAGRRSSLNGLVDLIDCAAIDGRLTGIHGAAKGEPAWPPPLALFKAMLIAGRYDLSDVKLAEAPDDLASFQRFCCSRSMTGEYEYLPSVRTCAQSRSWSFFTDD